MKPWTRTDTKNWIAKLENRIEDIEFYLKRSNEWCEENEIYSEKVSFVCNIMTLVWVSHLRDEPISRKELFEILGIESWNEMEDAIFEFNPLYESMELEELLQFVVDSF